jgi:catechol 2,3-dioxygenase-like lactoylglutathione lyase family enzyme
MLDKPTEARIAETKLGAPIDPGTRIGHVHLKVADIDRALGFYCGVLGFGLIRATGRAPPSPLPPAPPSYRPEYLSKGGPPPAGTTGLYHLQSLPDARASLTLRRLMRLASSSTAPATIQRGALSARPRPERHRALLGLAERIGHGTPTARLP